METACGSAVYEVALDAASRPKPREENVDGETASFLALELSVVTSKAHELFDKLDGKH